MIYPVPPNNYRELKTVVIAPAGNRSQVTRAIMYNTGTFKPVNYTANTAGLKYHLMKGTFDSVDELDKAAIADSGTVKNLDITGFKKDNKTFGVIYTGYINADTDGTYGFAIQSANGSSVLIDNQIIIDNDGKHRLYEQSGAVPLQKGYHQITIKYFNNGGRGGLKLFMTAPGKAKTEADNFYN